MTRRFANIAHQSDKASPQSWLCSFLRAEKLTSQRARCTRVDYVYNRRNQLTRMLHTRAATVLLGLSYLLNPDGSRASIIEQTHAVDAQQHALFNVDGSPQLEQQRRTDYVYDDLKRLVHEAVDARIDSNDRTTAWTYDKVGNRQTQSQQNGVGALAGTAARRETIAYTYDANDRLLTETTSTTADAGATSTTEATTHRYDLNGNLLETSTPNRIERYRWNAENRLVQHEKTSNGQTAITQYAYTADGLRNRIIANATTPNAITTRQLIDPIQSYAQVLEETIAIGANAPQLKTVYTHGDDLIAQHALINSDGTPATSGTSYLHYDGLGTTRFLTNDSGNVTDRYTYQAFGDLDEAATTYAFGSTAATDYLFTGEQYDPNLGFYYLRARYMDPTSGRFASLDRYAGSSSDPATLHKYMYGNANPVMGIDPNGFSTNTAEQSVAMNGTLGLARMALPRVATQSHALRFAANDPLYAVAHSGANVATMTFARSAALKALALAAAAGGIDRLLGVPILWTGTTDGLPETSAHIMEAQLGFGNTRLSEELGFSLPITPGVLPRFLGHP